MKPGIASCSIVTCSSSFSTRLTTPFKLVVGHARNRGGRPSDIAGRRRRGEVSRGTAGAIRTTAGGRGKDANHSASKMSYVA